eukprot:2419238-Pleurochrysis_carterae.AAC.6
MLCVGAAAWRADALLVLRRAPRFKCIFIEAIQGLRPHASTVSRVWDLTACVGARSFASPFRRCRLAAHRAKHFAQLRAQSTDDDEPHAPNASYARKHPRHHSHAKSAARGEADTLGASARRTVDMAHRQQGHTKGKGAAKSARSDRVRERGAGEGVGVQRCGRRGQKVQSAESMSAEVATDCGGCNGADSGYGSGESGSKDGSSSGDGSGDESGDSSGDGIVGRGASIADESSSEEADEAVDGEFEMLSFDDCAETQSD